METLIDAFGLYAGLMVGLLVLSHYEVIPYRATIAAAFLASGLWFLALATAPEVAFVPEPAETVAQKSNSMLSRPSIRRLFSQAQADEATKIDDSLTHLFNQFDPTPLPRARPHGRTLMWHWCNPQRRLVTAQDWRDCAGKTAISPLLTQPFPPLPTKG